MIIFRYIAGGVLARLALALPSLALLVLAFDLGDQGSRLASQVGWCPVLLASLLHLPLALVEILPAALLISATLALSALRQQGELDGLALAGAGPGRLWVPVLACGLICTAAAFALDEAAVPPCERAADRLYQQRRVSALTGLLPGTGWVRVGPWFLHRGDQRDAKGLRDQVLALEIDLGRDSSQGKTATPARIGQRIEGRMKGQADRLAAVRLRVFPRGVTSGQDRPRARTIKRLGFPALVEAGRLWKQLGDRAEALGLLDLARRLARRERAGQLSPAEHLVLHTKLAFPLVNLIAALLACSFALGWHRRSPLLDLLVCVGQILGLWFLMAGGWVLGQAGWLAPAAAVWSPLLLAAGLAAGLLWAVYRSTSGGGQN